MGITIDIHWSDTVKPGYRLFDRLTPFDTSKQLADKNTAVGIVVGSIFIGMGTAISLVIGMGLN